MLICYAACVPPKPTITIIGAGNLAQTLAPALHRAGYRIEEVVSRGGPDSRRRANKLARRVHARAVNTENASLAARVIWFCITDDAIAESARTLANRTDWRRKIAFHSSGALSSGLLSVLQDRGASIGSVHPMMTFVRNSAAGMKGVPFALEGDPQAVSIGRRIALDLGGVPFHIAKENKVLYHAMGSFSSPMVVAVLALAERIAAAAGIPRSKIPAAMRPILLKTVENYLKNGAAAAFSGPINRGDVNTVRKHLAELQKVPLAREAYIALARAAVEMLPVKRKKELLKVLTPGGHSS
jgi:predicted short-subunit dehydrogenase-like oxidoreductase (DUF2520 family)